MTRQRSFLPIALLLLLTLCSGPLQAAELEGLQRGTATSTANGTLTVALADAVDPSRSVLFFSTRHDSNRPPGSTLRGSLASATTLEFERVSSESAPIDVHWTVLEFASGVRVQRGEFDQTSATMTIDLPTPVASTTQAFALWSKTAFAGDSLWGSDDPVGGYLLNNSQLRFRAVDANNAHRISYQVVEFTDPADIFVQAGDSPGMNGGNGQRLVNLTTSVDPERSFIVSGFTIDDDGADVGERMMRAEFDDANTVRFSRQATGDEIDRILWQVVELRDGSRVLRGIDDFGAGEVARTRPLPVTVDPSRAVALSGVGPVGGQNMGSSDYQGDDVIGVGSFTFELTPSQLQLRRASASGNASVGWFVIEFNSALGTGPVLDLRMDEPAWSGLPGEVVDEVGGNDGQALGGAGTARSNPALSGNPGTCRYGDFDGIDDMLEFADAPHLDMPDALTVAIWVYARRLPGSGLMSIVSKDTNYEFHLTASGNVNWWWNDASGSVRQFDSSAQLETDRWYHLAITYESGNQVIYVDGAPAGSRSFGGDLATNDLPLQIGQDQGFAGREWDGLLDEVRIFDRALAPGEVADLAQETQPCADAPVGEWRFDEIAWNGSAGEVADSSGNGFDGAAFNSAPVPGLVCNAADLGANSDTDYLSLDADALNGSGDFTFMLWYRGTQNSDFAVVSGARAGEANELIFWFPRPDRFDPYLGGSQGSDVAIDPFNDGDWHHLAWTREGASNCLYVDAVLQDCETRPSAPLTIDPGGFIVGQEQDSVGGAFVTSQDVEGDLDELLLFASALPAAEIAAIRANHLAGLGWDGTPRGCAAAGAGRLEILHDNAAIHCLAEPVRVRALDLGGGVVSDYASEVTLDSGSGRGSWSLLQGSGTFLDHTSDDGLASYRFDPADDGAAEFLLSYGEGPPELDVDAFETADPSVADDDGEGLLRFAPSGFTVTASALGNPPASPLLDPLGAQTAGRDFAVHVTAYGTTPDDPQCGVIESYAGDRPVAFWLRYDDPGTGTRQSLVDGTPAAASSSTAVAQVLSFDAGQAVATVNYRDAGAVTLLLEDGASYDNVLSGSTGSFVVRPDRLEISRVEGPGGEENLAPTTDTGSRFVPAGTPFRVDVDALDVDGGLLPNFGLENSPARVQVISEVLLVPASGRNGSTGDVLGGAAFAPTATAGRQRNPGVRFDEVGIIQLRPSLQAGDYMGSGPVSGVLSEPVGRFYPAAFEVVSASTAASCGSFSYLGEPGLSLAYEVEARGADGTVTANYDTDLLSAAALADAVHVAEAHDDGVSLSARLSPLDPRWQDGRLTLATADLSLARTAAPDGPFDPLQLGLALVDTQDAVPLGGLDMNPGSSGSCVVAGNCTARSLGAPLRLVYGRLQLLPSAGPENLPLDVGLVAQQFVDGAFRVHGADDCSQYSAAALTLGAFSGNLADGETVPVAPGSPATLLDGRPSLAAPLLLAAPGFGNDGSVSLVLDVPSWLEFDWLGSGDIDPTAEAVFGRYRGHDRIIFWSELQGP